MLFGNRTTQLTQHICLHMLYQMFVIQTYIKNNKCVCVIGLEHVVENQLLHFLLLNPLVSLCVTLRDSCRLVSGELELNHGTLQCGALVALSQPIL